MSVTKSQAAAILSNLGWGAWAGTHFTQAVMDFQRGWNLGTALAIDGKVGALTSSALLKSEANRRAGYGTCSAHFSFTEFRCTCNGRFSTCRRIWILRAQVQRVEVYRSHAGATSIISGCRCPKRNAEVGGASSSQHMWGSAVDVKPKFGPSTIRSWRQFAGIGYGARSGLVCHVDSRDRSGNNPTSGTSTAPTTWIYNSY